MSGEGSHSIVTAEYWKVVLTTVPATVRVIGTQAGSQRLYNVGWLNFSALSASQAAIPITGNPFMIRYSVGNGWTIYWHLNPGVAGEFWYYA